MSKVSRVAAFSEITKTMDYDGEKANKMFQIVSESIAKDKKYNTFSEFIELKNKGQEILFKNIIIEDKQDDCNIDLISEEEFSKLSIKEMKSYIIEVINELPENKARKLYENIKEITGIEE